MTRQKARGTGAIPLILSVLSLLRPGICADKNPYSLDVRTDKLLVVFSHRGANPALLSSYYPSGAAPRSIGIYNTQAQPPVMRLMVYGDSALSERLNDLSYDLQREEAGHSVVMRFTSEPLADNVNIEKTYIIPRQGYVIGVIIRIYGKGAGVFLRRNKLEIRMGCGPGFIPDALPGFSGSGEKLAWVHVKGTKVTSLPGIVSDTLRQDHWAGFRNRFWTLLLRPKNHAGYINPPGAGRPLEARVTLLPKAREYLFHLYAGPIEYSTLKKGTFDLRGLLFTHLWFWLRWLCFGMLFLLEFLIRCVKSHGAAIILLSLCVKIIMAPLIHVAERWQKDVNAKKSLLQPLVDEIKRKCRGEERNRRILALHKEHGVSPFFALKSVFSAFVQIPFFIAAYDMLSENIALRGVPFLWIGDLSLPDRLWRLPFTLPFFGEYINALPFLMTILTLLSSWLFHDPSLSKRLLHKQRVNLYIMALLFFILFYTFPAGMVLYWTTNNFVSFIKAFMSQYRLKQ